MRSLPITIATITASLLVALPALAQVSTREAYLAAMRTRMERSRIPYYPNMENAYVNFGIGVCRSLRRGLTVDQLMQIYRDSGETVETKAVAILSAVAATEAICPQYLSDMDEWLLTQQQRQ